MLVPFPLHRSRGASRLLLLWLCAGTWAMGEESKKLPQMSLEEILSLKVTVATRTDSTVIEAPSVVSVITAEEIRRMGARDLRDVLKSVPGFELGIRVFGYPEFGLRGVATDNTEKIRILLDGVPVNENLEGSGTIVFGDLAMDNIERIEIIRGPGSALYGTNAFMGVISIITKAPPASGAATTVRAQLGGFGTQEASVLTGWSGPDLRLSAYVHYLNTEGPQSPVGRDALRFRQAPPWLSDTNAGVSLAGTPAGHTSEFRRKLTAQLKIDYADFFFNGTFVDTRKGPYVGTLWTINRHSEAHPFQLQGTAGWTFRPSDDLVIEPKFYALHYKANNLWNGFPDGYRIPDGSGGTTVYTRGRYDRQGGTQDTYGTEVKGTWNSAYGHKVTAGISFEKERLYKVVNQTNEPGHGPERMVDAGPIMKKNPSRTLSSLFVQDQWGPHPNLGITAGIRMDRYDDAGTAVNPRLAVVWRMLPPLTLKVLYGEAFRAPTFVESYLYAYGGFAQGRVDNKPETIRTSEVEGSYRFGDRALWRVALFRNRITNLIQFVAAPGGYLEYRNSPEITNLQGIESEVKLTLTETLGGFINVSGQSGRNESTGEAVVGTARWRANAGFDLSPSDELTLHASLNVVGPRPRSASDPRPELSGYRVVDFAVNYNPVPKMELTVSVHNLFDADQRFPDLAGGLPADFPWEGRHFQAGIRWRF